MTPELEIQLTAAVVAVACALPGAFLVLRRMAMMSDAISHAILLGIAVGFLLIGDPSSPLLLLAAAATGLLTVAAVEALQGTRLVREDAAIGLVFPALFSGGVILISRYARDVHLDMDAVLLGELVFAPFHRLVVAGHDLGPRSLWVMGAILLLNAGFLALFYKELKLATFDAALAGALGLAPGALHYAFMSLVSLTAVGAFEAVGSVLVVALMIAPPAAAYLLTDRLPWMVALSATLGVVSALGGYWLSFAADVSVAGSMASVAGALFGAALLLAPQRGVLATARRRRRQRWSFAEAMLTIHLLHHEGSPAAAEENRVAHLHRHLRWAPSFASRVVRRAIRAGLVAQPVDQRLVLTDRGRSAARAAVGE